MDLSSLTALPASFPGIRNAYKGSLRFLCVVLFMKKIQALMGNSNKMVIDTKILLP